MTAGTRVVLITGRPARELVVLSGIHPHTEIWGSHGMERLLPNGHYELTALSATQTAALTLAADALRRDGLEDPQIELKPGGIAVHWRGMGHSDIVQLREKVLSQWKTLSENHSLHILNFDGGIELRGSGRDKGKAINDILKTADSSTAVAYLGDDETDEDAFRSLKGKGLTALVRTESRASIADVWLQPPQELVQFLRDWLQVYGKEADQA
jgi:trehalose-phosphatase